MPDRSLRSLALRGFVAVFLPLACALFLATAAAAQPPPIQYVYDALGRLVAVADRDGNAAIYVYDAVGNILEIQRVDAANLPGQVAITFVSPGKGKPGTVVSILGKGFGASPAQNAVSFNGAPAAVSSAAANRIIATVPAGATTGPITVTAPLGSAVSPQPFRVLGDLAVTPATASLGAGGTQQFDATEGGATTTNVTWSVNGVVGGDSAVGTISTQGLYTAPAGLGASLTVTVTAADKDDLATTASATVTVLPPIQGTTAARAVSVQGSSAATMAGAPAVSVTVPASMSTEASALVSVYVPPAATTAGAPIVSVTVPASVSTEATALVSVNVLPAHASAGAALVSVGLEPTVTAVLPATGARGATVAITIQGHGFQGAALAFLRNNAPDATITVSNLVVDGTGAQLTADVSVDSGAATGGRVVRITTPAGVSTAVGTGSNVFTVQ